MKSKLFTKVLVANRGEIAIRVMRACRELGIATAAVYSDADRNAIHVRYADEAHHIGGAPPTESYLQLDRIVKVAHDCGAEAIHPGYGFLSEKAAFPDACEAAGIKFIGPPGSARRDIRPGRRYRRGAKHRTARDGETIGRRRRDRDEGCRDRRSARGGHRDQ